MNQTVDRALIEWDMAGAPYEFIAARENAVFKVDAATGSYALRLHRQGYRTDAELRSELQWMKAVAEGGIEVPVPIPSKGGDVLCTLDGTQVDVLTWLSGSTLEQAMDNRRANERSGLFKSLGQKMKTSSAWLGMLRVYWGTRRFGGRFGVIHICRQRTQSCLNDFATLPLRN